VQTHPTLQDILEGYQRFNAWEREERMRALSHLTIEQSLTQFFELCSIARDWYSSADERTMSADVVHPSANTRQVFLEQDVERWVALREKLQRAAKTMNDVQTT
jgi:hypothetical protein